MKNKIIYTYYTYRSSILLLLTVFAIVSCRKEKLLEPSGLDENYFVIKDNPDNSVDHAIFTFYQNTGIPCYYTDTAAKVRISEEGEIPERFKYIELAFNYSPMGINAIKYSPLSSKEKIPSFLQLMQEKVIPRFPKDIDIKSFFLIDSFNNNLYSRIQIQHGMTSIYGFNTIGIVVKQLSNMNESERDWYAASLLSGFAERMISRKDAESLQEDFYGVTRRIVSPYSSLDPYSGIAPASMNLPPSLQNPGQLGLLYFPYYLHFLFLTEYQALPLEFADLRSFLTAIFHYSPQEIEEIFAPYPAVLQKVSVLKKLIINAGFTLPE